MGCIVDKQQTKEVYPSCVLDYGKPEDCSKAKGKDSREQCEFWIHDEKSMCPHCWREMPSNV